jgi:hypothetical protein
LLLVAVVHAPDAVLAIRIASAPISSARSAPAVSVVKKGCAGGKDDDAALLEVADGPPPDIWLRNLGDRERT